MAFPVFTKVLTIPAAQARIFTYAIQSFGMGCASLSILYLRLPIERRILFYAAPAGIGGILFSSNEIAPHVSLPLVRIYFTVLLTSLALALLVLQVRRVNDRNLAIPRFGPAEAVILVVTGFAGGVVSGLVGVGENIVAFIVLVMLFRISEKIATPTTVILMALVSMAGFFSHALLLHDFRGPVPQYWLAAVPIVVIGAPLGALICSRFSRTVIRGILVTLIGADLVSTLILIHIPDRTRLIAVGLLVAFTALCYLLTTVSRYDPPAPAAVPAALGRPA